MKEYDIYVPSQYNDGRPIEPGKLATLKAMLVKEFGGMTWFPQENEGLWRMCGITFRDKVTILRVITREVEKADCYLRELKPVLQQDFGQEEFLIISREVSAL